MQSIATEMDFDDLDRDTLSRRRGKKWNTYGPDVLPAWVADMDFRPAPAIQARLERVVADGDLGYPFDAHADRIVDLLVKRSHERHRWRTDSRHVELIADVMQGVKMCLQLFARPGEGVAIQTPIYPPFLQATEAMERRADCSTLIPGSDAFEIDQARLEASLRADTRMLLLCNPHNPTGRVFTRKELTKLADIALERDLVVVSDEIHADLVYTGHQHVPFASLGPEIESRTVTLTSATKSFNIAGLRCAMMVFGSEELHAAYRAGPRFVRGAISSLGMHATEAAWTEGDEWLSALNCHLEGNRDLIKTFLAARLPAIRFLPPEATYLAWLDCRELGMGEALWRTILDKGELALNDGREFGPGGEGCVRLNFATSRRLLGEALNRLETALL